MTPDTDYLPHYTVSQSQRNKEEKIKTGIWSLFSQDLSTNNTLSPKPRAANLVVINSELDSGFMLLPFLFPGEEQDYLGTDWQYPKLVIHFFCNSIHALPTKPWVNLQTKQSYLSTSRLNLILCLISHLPDSQHPCSIAVHLPSPPSSTFHTLPPPCSPLPTIFLIYSTQTQCPQSLKLQQIKLTNTMV